MEEVEGTEGETNSHSAAALFKVCKTQEPSGCERRLTYAAHSGGVELKVGGAVAQVAARGVGAQPVDAVDRVGALVDVCGRQ